MKKLILTAILFLGFAMGSYAQELYLYQKNSQYGGLFGLGPVYDEPMRNDGLGLYLPGHNLTTHWNGNVQGQDVSPLGSGALLLIGFGAAYALSKRSKKD